MNFKTAIKNEMSNKGNHDANIQAIYDAVEPLCKTATDGNDGETTTLHDWLDDGQYSESDTPESLAGDWDALDE